MKRLLIVFVLLALPVAALAARRMPWTDTRRPALSLPDAYACALTALGPATNQYYCVRARCGISRSPDGEWLFIFSSTNAMYKSVFVFFDKTTRIEEGLVKR